MSTPRSGGFAEKLANFSAESPRNSRRNSPLPSPRTSLADRNSPSFSSRLAEMVADSPRNSPRGNTSIRTPSNVSAPVSNPYAWPGTPQSSTTPTSGGGSVGGGFAARLAEMTSTPRSARTPGGGLPLTPSSSSQRSLNLLGSGSGTRKDTSLKNSQLGDHGLYGGGVSGGVATPSPRNTSTQPSTSTYGIQRTSVENTSSAMATTAVTTTTTATEEHITIATTTGFSGTRLHNVSPPRLQIGSPNDVPSRSDLQSSERLMFKPLVPPSNPTTLPLDPVTQQQQQPVQSTTSASSTAQQQQQPVQSTTSASSTAQQQQQPAQSTTSASSTAQQQPSAARVSSVSSVDSVVVESAVGGGSQDGTVNQPVATSTTPITKEEEESDTLPPRSQSVRRVKDRRGSIQAPQTTVGLVLKGCAVDYVVEGGSAYKNGHIETGDVMVSVDGVPATDRNLGVIMKGPVGSFATIIWRKSGPKRPVSEKGEMFETLLERRPMWSRNLHGGGGSGRVSGGIPEETEISGLTVQEADDLRKKLNDAETSLSEMESVLMDSQRVLEAEREARLAAEAAHSGCHTASEAVLEVSTGITKERDELVKDKESLYRDLIASQEDRDQAYRELLVKETERLQVHERIVVLEQERDAAISERDEATREHVAICIDKDVAVTERDTAIAERDAANSERDVLLSQVSTLTADKNANVQTVGVLSDEVHVWKAKFGELQETSSATMDRRMSESNERAAALKKTIDELRDELRAKEGELSEMEQRVSEVQAIANDAERRANEAESQIADLQQACTELRVDLTEMAESSATAADEHTAELAALSTARDGIVTERDTAKGELVQTAGKLEEMVTKHDALLSERDALIGERDALSSDLATATATVTERGDTVTSIRELLCQAEAHPSAPATPVSGGAVVTSPRGRQGAAGVWGDGENALTRLRSLLSQLSRHRAGEAVARDALNKLRQTHAATVSELEMIQAAHETLSCQHTEATDAAKVALDDAESRAESANERCGVHERSIHELETTLEATRQELRNSQESLSQEAIVVTSLRSEVAALQNAAKVAADAEKLRAASNPDAQLLRSANAEVTEQRARADDLLQRAVHAETKMDSVVVRMADVVRECEDERDQRHALEAQLSQARVESSNIAATLEEKEQRIVDLLADVLQAKATAGECQAREHAGHSVAQSDKMELASTKARCEELLQQLGQAQAARDKAHDEGMRDAEGQALAKRSEMEKEMLQLQLQLESAGAQISALETRVEESEAARTEASAAAASEADRLQGLVVSALEAQGEGARTLQEEIASLQRNVRAKEEEARRLRADLEEQRRWGECVAPLLVKFPTIHVGVQAGPQGHPTFETSPIAQRCKCCFARHGGSGVDADAAPSFLAPSPSEWQGWKAKLDASLLESGSSAGSTVVSPVKGGSGGRGQRDRGRGSPARGKTAGGMPGSGYAVHSCTGIGSTVTSSDITPDYKLHQLDKRSGTFAWKPPAGSSGKISVEKIVREGLTDDPSLARILPFQGRSPPGLAQSDLDGDDTGHTQRRQSDVGARQRQGQAGWA